MFLSYRVKTLGSCFRCVIETLMYAPTKIFIFHRGEARIIYCVYVHVIFIPGRGRACMGTSPASQPYFSKNTAGSRDYLGTSNYVAPSLWSYFELLSQARLDQPQRRSWVILKAIRAGGGYETNFDARPWPDETHLRRAGHHSQRLTPIARSVLQKRSSSYDKERSQLVTTRRYTVTIDEYIRYNMQQPCNLQTICRRPRDAWGWSRSRTTLEWTWVPSNGSPDQEC